MTFLCNILNLNRRSYYKWLQRNVSNREIENEILKEKILEIYHFVNGIYGYRRITMNINSQFTSKEYHTALKERGITHSMSRVGKCIDNGPMEGFFGNIKCEKYYLKKYKKLEELENDIHEYIKFYNNDRLQKNLNNLSPLNYRKYKGINVKNIVDN